MSVISTYEQQVLTEYAIMAQTLEKMANDALVLSDAQPALLEQMRPLEGKIGLILTIFKASMWNVLLKQEEAAELARQG